MNRRHIHLEHGLLALCGVVLAAFLAAPVLALVLGTSLADLRAGLAHPLVWPALRLSLFTTAVSLVVVVLLGTPLAWMLSRSRHKLVTAIETVVGLPIVIPPAVAGIALLFAFGHRGFFTGSLYPEAWALPFTTAAVVVAEIFVSAPLFVQTATVAFRRLDPALLIVARSCGASPLRVFIRIAVPLVTPALVAGAAMSWARSLGEFGATLMFAGSLQGRTQTLPLAIYAALETDVRVAQALSLLLIVIALAMLIIVRLLIGRAQKATS